MSVAVAAGLWGIEDLDAERLIQDLARLSLLEFDAASRTLSIHPVMRSYIEDAGRALSAPAGSQIHRPPHIAMRPLRQKSSRIRTPRHD
jgi:hypothetical protein